MFKYFLIRKLIASCVALCLSFLGLTLPALATAADNFLPSPQSIQYVQGQYASYPLDNPRLLASVQGPGNNCLGADCLTVYGQRSVNNGNELAAMLGIDNSQISNIVYSFPANSPIVFARYNPYAAETRIFLVKLLMAADGSRNITVLDYTPHHGQRMVAAREYMTPAERADVNRGGNNPFAGNRGAVDDPLFYNCGVNCTKVAVGHAMRQYNASVGLVAVADVTFEQQKKTKSSFLGLRKTTTVTTQGFVQPHWYVATSPEFQFQGAADAQATWTCAIAESVCAPEHMAYSGVAFIDWKDGSLSSIKEQKYTDTESQSSWTVLAMAFFMGALLALAAFTGGASLGTILQVGFGTVLGYAGGYALFGGVSPFAAQQGVFGATAWDVQAPGSTNRHQDKMNQIIRPIMATNDIAPNSGEMNKNPCGVLDKNSSTTDCYNYLQGVSQVTQGTTDRNAATGCTLGLPGCSAGGSLLRADASAVYDAGKEMGVEFNQRLQSNPLADIATRRGWAQEVAPEPKLNSTD